MAYKYPESDKVDVTKAWETMSVKQRHEVVEPLDHEAQQAENTLRLVCISDTHNQTARMAKAIPPGDVLVHAGDFSNVGTASDVKAFDEFLASQPHKYKVVIAGNHDISFDLASYDTLKPRFLPGEKMPAAEIKALLRHCTYLEDTGCIIDGVRFWGSPWQPEFCDWAFNLPRGEPTRQQWSKLPSEIDVLITHGPPVGHGDLCTGGHRAGCIDLLREIQTRIKPRVHIFGHIHEGYGCTTDGVTTYINASTCTYNYRPSNEPIVFDVAKPPGFVPGLTRS